MTLRKKCRKEMLGLIKRINDNLLEISNTKFIRMANEYVNKHGEIMWAIMFIDLKNPLATYCHYTEWYVMCSYQEYVTGLQYLRQDPDLSDRILTSYSALSAPALDHVGVGIYVALNSWVQFADSGSVFDSPPHIRLWKKNKDATRMYNNVLTDSTIPFNKISKETFERLTNIIDTLDYSKCDAFDRLVRIADNSIRECYIDDNMRITSLIGSALISTERGSCSQTNDAAMMLINGTSKIVVKLVSTENDCAYLIISKNTYLIIAEDLDDGRHQLMSYKINLNSLNKDRMTELCCFIALK